MLLLITKYNLSPKWVQILIFLIFYFILIKLHYFDSISDVAECTKRGLKNKDYIPARVLPFSEKPPEMTNSDYMLNGAYIGSVPDEVEHIHKMYQKTYEQPLTRVRNVVTLHDEILAPLVAEAKTRNTHPASILSEMLPSKAEALSVSPDLSNYVTRDSFQTLQTEVERQAKLLAPLEMPSAPVAEIVPFDDFSSKEKISSIVQQSITQEGIRLQGTFLNQLENLDEAYKNEQTILKNKLDLLENRINSLSQNNDDMLRTFKDLKETRNFSEVQQIINNNITFEQPGRESDVASADVPQPADSKCLPNGCCPNSTFSLGSLFKGCC